MILASRFCYLQHVCTVRLHIPQIGHQPDRGTAAQPYELFEKKKSRNASKPGEHYTQSQGENLSKRLIVDGNNSCKDENSSWNLNGLYSPIMSVE